MPKRRKTQEEFEKEVFELVGNEYIVLGKYINSYTKIRIKHTVCGTEYYVIPNHFLNGCRCPVCCPSPQKVVIGINSMWDTNPELAKMLANTDDGYKYTQQSMAKVDWKCPDCGFIIKNKTISNIKNQGLSCPMCGDGISYPNRLMLSLLNKLDVKFEREKSFDWCKYRIENKLVQGRYDFYFIHNNQEYIIEMDGEWHFTDNTLNGQTKEVSYLIDMEKDRLAKEHSICVIRIDCKESKLNYIQDKIINSHLNIIFNLSDIDWQECNRMSLTSLKIKASNLWNEKHDINIIAEIMRINRLTVIQWLKLCSSLGVCDYNHELECQKRLLKKCRKVLCIETNEIFDSIVEASKRYNVDKSHISYCCQGKLKSAGKFSDGRKIHWSYATEEEIQLHNIKTA